MTRIYKWLEQFFWRTLCCRPDGGWLHWRWYNFTSRIAGYFHGKWCQMPECQGRAYRVRK